MKRNLIEKIEMVSVSRCNLLSHTLPGYQKEMLTYFDSAATEFHKLLTKLREQSQHQYKVTKLMDEIRHLENEETHSKSESLEDADKENTEVVTSGDGVPEAKDEMSEKPLIDMLQDELYPPYSASQLLEGEDTVIPPPEQPIEPSEDLLGDFNDGELTAEKEMSRLMDILNIDDQSALASDSAPSEATAQSVASPGVGSWDKFSSFMDVGANDEGDTSGWEKELLAGAPPDSTLTSDLEELFSSDAQLDLLAQQGTLMPAASKPDEVTFDPLLEPNQNVQAEKSSTTSSTNGESGLQQLGLDSMMFQQSNPPLLMPTLLEHSQTPAITGPQAMLSAPMQPHSQPASSFPLGSAMATPQQWRAPIGISSLSSQPNQATADKREESKKKPWTDVFAHLDPIANEKA